MFLFPLPWWERVLRELASEAGEGCERKAVFPSPGSCTAYAMHSPPSAARGEGSGISHQRYAIAAFKLASILSRNAVVESHF
jgi:hypothetical protein